MALTGVDTSGRLDQERQRTATAGRFSGFPGVVENEAGDYLAGRLRGTVAGGSTSDIKHMKSETVESMLSMATEYTARTGKKLHLTEGYRTFEEQVKMRQEKGSLAAIPGTSAHGYGTAFDINSKQANELRDMGLLKKHGFRQNVKGEAWHIEKEQDTKAASADKRYRGELAKDGGMGSGDSTDRGLNELKQIQSDLTRICAEIGNIRNEDAWLTRIRQEGTNTWVAS